jgi:hypothetical protein
MPSSFPVDPSTSLRAQELLESVMLMTEQTPDTAAPRWRRPTLFVAAATAVVAIGVGTVLANTGDPTRLVRTPQARSVLALNAEGGQGVSSHSCVQFSVDVLRNMPVAFGGTVTDINESTVSLTVDRWFKGGTAEIVTVARPPGNTSIPDVAFAKGTRYLITATDGTVNSCGFSAEATPQLEKSFERAFPR